mmetsp:Transcript_33399/g.92402  ORF Transcript_33399/g.92402 Transcript_33399/m.92402 type:complete len:252 (+) Transcript_33399:1956-2711(+)
MGGRAEVNLQRHILVGDGGVKHPAHELLWECLGLRDALAIAEDTDGVGVRALGIKVHQHRHCLVAGELLGDLLPVPLIDKVALRVKTHIVGAVAQEERGARGGYAQTHELLGLRCAALAALGLTRVQALHNPCLEHVPPCLHANGCTGTRQQILEAALRQRHENLPISNRHDVDRAVGRADGRCTGLQPRTRVLRGVLLQLLAALRLLLWLGCDLLLGLLSLRFGLLCLRGVHHLGVLRCTLLWRHRGLYR